MTPSDFERLQQVLPRYEIRGEIGRGGWGVVYEGWHRELQRSVAIKQLPHQLGSDPNVRDRFIAEAQRVASLEHPHIVPVYDFAEQDGLYVIVMELASGGTVWERFTTHGIRADVAIGTVLAAASGLHHAHSRGLLHRDVKPDNMLYSASGTAKIADFGIAKSMTVSQAGRAPTQGAIGTPAYMAPEQVVGETLSAATDVYALASVLYELLSGHLPFAGQTDPMALLFQRVHESARPVQAVAPGLSSSIASVVDRALLRDPAARPATAEQFAVELAQATTQSFGTGWLERCEVTVMGSTAVIGATQRSSGGTPFDASAGTVVIQPTDTERVRLGPAPLPASPTTDPPSTSEARRNPSEQTAPTPSRRWLGALAAALAIAAVAFLAISFLGADDPVTTAERSEFIAQCEASDVAASLCQCAVDQGIAELDADVFRNGLTTMTTEQGRLSAEFTELFETCVANGF